MIGGGRLDSEDVEDFLVPPLQEFRKLATIPPPLEQGGGEVDPEAEPVALFPFPFPLRIISQNVIPPPDEVAPAPPTRLFLELEGLDDP